MRSSASLFFDSVKLPTELSLRLAYVRYTYLCRHALYDPLGVLRCWPLGGFIQFIGITTVGYKLLRVYRVLVGRYLYQ